MNLELNSSKNLETDILIIGNGALGLFLANELGSRKTRKPITVVGPQDRYAGASQAAGAMLGCFGEVTSDTLRTEAGRKRFEIGVEAHSHWDKKISDLRAYSDTPDALKTTDQTYIILNSIGGELDSENFSAILEALEIYQKPWKEVDPGEIPAFNPRPDCRSFRAICLPDEGAINARNVLTALEKQAQEIGVVIIDNMVSQVTSVNGKVSGVKLFDGTTIAAEIIVVAAGAHSESIVLTASPDISLLPTFPGLGLGILAKRSQGEAFSSVVRTPNRGFACGLHIVPQSNSMEYIGSTNRIVHQVMGEVWLEDARYLTKYAMQQLDEKIANHHIDKFLRGNRPITLDGFPLIGWLDVQGLYLMTGTYRDGYHSAPFLSDLAASEIFGELGKVDPLFAPRRKPVSTRTIEHSIHEYAHHSVATWYETGADSCVMPTSNLYEIYADKARKVYDALDIDFPLGPDVLWYAADGEIGARHIKRYFDGTAV